MRHVQQIGRCGHGKVFVNVNVGSSGYQLGFGAATVTAHKPCNIE